LIPSTPPVSYLAVVGKSNTLPLVPRTPKPRIPLPGLHLLYFPIFYFWCILILLLGVTGKSTIKFVAFFCHLLFSRTPDVTQSLHGLRGRKHRPVYTWSRAS